jgi:hypothetical protein
MRRVRSDPRRPESLKDARGGRSATLMVGPVRGPEHLDLIHRLRFYHVPAASIAASRTGVSYVAFYEGGSRFGCTPGAIRVYAPVLRVSRVLRKELPGLTWSGRHGEEAPYYRFDLGPPATLPRPITNPDGLRVAFLFPRVDQFHQAATLRDLGRGAMTRGGRKAVGSKRAESGRQGG